MTTTAWRLPDGRTIRRHQATTDVPAPSSDIYPRTEPLGLPLYDLDGWPITEAEAFALLDAVPTRLERDARALKDAARELYRTSGLERLLETLARFLTRRLGGRLR